MARVYQPCGAKGWYVDYRDASGKRVRKRVASDKRTAERILREWVRNAELARAGLAAYATNDVDVWELYDGFRSYLVANGRRPQTVRFYRNRVTPFLRFIGAEEEDEIARLLARSLPQYRRVWIAFLTTGLRHRELVELRWRDVDLQSTLLRVSAENCKLRREDLLPIAPEFETVLRELVPACPDPNGHIFLNADGRPWRHNLLKRFRTCLKAAGIDPEGLDIHSLRQTFGTRLASDPTIDVKSVQTLMRHKTIAMTMQVYVKPRAIRLREAVAKLSLPGGASNGSRAATASLATASAAAT